MPKPHCSTTSHVVLLAIAFAAVIVASAQSQPRQSKSGSSQGANAPAATVSQSSDYVGSETCKACHEDVLTTDGKKLPTGKRHSTRKAVRHTKDAKAATVLVQLTSRAVETHPKYLSSRITRPKKSTTAA